MSARRTKLNVSQSEWQEMASLKSRIDQHLTVCTVDELERFTELFVTTLRENNATAWRQVSVPND